MLSLLVAQLFYLYLVRFDGFSTWLSDRGTAFCATVIATSVDNDWHPVRARERDETQCVFRISRYPPIGKLRKYATRERSETKIALCDFARTTDQPRSVRHSDSSHLSAGIQIISRVRNERDDYLDRRMCVCVYASPETFSRENSDVA